MVVKLKARPEGEGRALEVLKVEYLPLSDLKPNEYNPNRQSEHEFELLCRSMKEDGFTQPVLAMMDGTIIDGEHRWRAAQALGIDPIPVVRVNMSESQRRVATLRHNLARGSHDMELVGGILKDLESLGAIEWAQDALMLDSTELDRLLNDVQAPEELGKDQEWSESWEPAKISTVADADGCVSERAHLNEALRKDPVARERDREERQMRAADHAQAMKTVTINFCFSADQWSVIKEVLGTNRADGLYNLCLKTKQTT